VLEAEGKHLAATEGAGVIDRLLLLSHMYRFKVVLASRSPQNHSKFVKICGDSKETFPQVAVENSPISEYL